MAVRIKSITIDCADPYALTLFWAQVTGFAEDPDNGNAPEDPEGLLCSPDGAPALLFIRVPDPKRTKNRLHLDLVPQDRDRDAEVDRLLGLGAVLVEDRRRPDGSGWAVLADPEGNEFCVERSDRERESPVEALGRAAGAVDRLIGGVAPDQWSAPTPCRDWTVRQLVTHLVGMNRVHAALAAGQPRPDRRDDLDPAALRRAFTESAQRLQSALARPGVLERAVAGPLGTATGADRLQMRLYDLLAHGWDLARATGQPAGLPDDLAERSLTFARGQLTAASRPGRFDPPRSAPADRSAIDRLVAFLGRDLGWAPPGRPAGVGDGSPATGTFTAADGTRLSFRRWGEADPVLWIPGGPMRDSTYLSTLGGLTAAYPCVLLDLRGTGTSARPVDPATYRCDRQVADVEALRIELGRPRLDLAAHSAGAAVALHYAARYPERVRRLVLVTPSPRVLGIAVTDEDRRRVVEMRRGEPWFAAAYAALERIGAGADGPTDWRAIAPFSHGRWDGPAQQLQARDETERNADAAARYYAPGGPDAAALRSALAATTASVWLLAGTQDIVLPLGPAEEYARVFPDAEIVVQPDAGHYPWLDDPDRFVASVVGFLRR